MSYHIEDARGSFNELPERILMREDGYLGAYKFHGKPIVDYWYVPMERAERLESENAKLRELVRNLYKRFHGVVLENWSYSTEDFNMLACRMRELGVEVEG